MASTWPTVEWAPAWGYIPATGAGEEDTLPPPSHWWILEEKTEVAWGPYFSTPDAQWARN